VVALQLGQPAINLLPVRRDAGMWRTADGTPLLAAETTGPSERLLGVRPEAITPVGLDEIPSAEAASSVRPAAAVVRVVEYIGPTTTLLCEWAGTHVHIVVPRRASFRPGDRLRPHIDAARAILFDSSSSGRALPISPPSLFPPGGST
jgi:ABC-type sugar transport system ATPase subunit